MTVDDLISQAYSEDLPAGDLTTESLGLAEVQGGAQLLAKEDLVLSGREIFTKCIHFINPETSLQWQFNDGEFVLNKQVVCVLRGNLIHLLKAERVALNFLGHLSGIATLTRCFVQETKGSKCRILDTRKTTPLLRRLEKNAVKSGGGFNHRMSLSDAILIKENHIRAAGGFRQALRIIRKRFAGPIEVECSTLEEVGMAVEEKVQRILLDNMNLETLREARKMIPSIIQVEASGNMTLERIRSVAALDIDFISVGALTHSAPCADFSMIFEWPAARSKDT